MQISLRLHLYTSKTLSDKSHPIILQYIIEGKVKKKTIGRCKPDDWDFKKNRVRSKVENSNRINDYLSEQFSKAERELYDLKNGELELSDIFQVKDRVTLDGAFEKEKARLSAEFKSGYYDKIVAMQRQLPDRAILVSDINARWFESTMALLANMGNSPNTIKKKVKLLRGIIGRYSDKGVTKEMKDIAITTTKPVRQKLTGDELALLAGLELEAGSQLEATRDLFLMQVYLRGIRVGDILQARKEQFANSRFTYAADKTGKEVSVKLIPAAVLIVDRYAGKYERLFPFFYWTANKKLSKFENERARLKHKETCTTVINKHLKVLAVMAGIKKPLTSHIARHTFARMAIDKINNPMVTMELLGHSSLAVHQAYLNDIRKDDVLDAAADDIFG